MDIAVHNDSTTVITAVITGKQFLLKVDNMNVSERSDFTSDIGNSSGRSAVVVEDDANTARALSKIVAALGYSVSIADSLEQARVLVDAKAPELVVLDVKLPDGDGLQLMEESSSSFVVVTGDTSQETAIRSLRLRAVDFLNKPVGLEELRNSLVKVTDYLGTQTGKVGNNTDSTDAREDLISRYTYRVDGVEEVSPGDDQPPELNPAKGLVGKTFWAVERELLQATLEHHAGDKKLAAKTLGISLKTLYNRLNAYSIDPA